MGRKVSLPAESQIVSAMGIGNRKISRKASLWPSITERVPPEATNVTEPPAEAAPCWCIATQKGCNSTNWARAAQFLYLALFPEQADGNLQLKWEGYCNRSVTVKRFFCACVLCSHMQSCWCWLVTSSRAGQSASRWQWVRHTLGWMQKRFWDEGL